MARDILVLPSVESALKKIPLYVFGIANIAMGVLNLIWGDFDPAHQPIQSFGNHIPGREIFAYITGILLVSGGIGILLRGRFARFGAADLALINFIVAIFWVPRLYTAPHYLGLSISVISGVLGGIGRQLIIACAALLAFPQRNFATAAARWIFGLSAIDFGAVHLTTVSSNLIYVPPWMPFGREFGLFLPELHLCWPALQFLSAF